LIALGLLPNSVSAKARPSAIAIGVKLMRLVQSPTAKMCGPLVRLSRVTAIAHLYHFSKKELQ
jgi:hypothetical protein